MKRCTWILILAAGGAASGQPLSWPTDAPRLIAHQMVSSNAMFDLLRLERSADGRNDWIYDASASYTLSDSGFSYTLTGSQYWFGQSFALTTTGVFDGVDTWTTTTTGSFGLIDLSAVLRTTITLGPSGFSAVTRDAAAPKAFEPDENWTVEVSPGGGFAVSTHSTSGATDRGVLNPDTRRYDWRITTPESLPRVQVYGSGDFSAGSGTFVGYVVPTPGAAALMAIGLATLGRRRA